MCTLCANIPASPTCIGVPGTSQNAPGEALEQTGLAGGIASSGSGYAVEAGDSGETAATAGSLELDVTLYGTIDTYEDSDWYAIDLVAGQTYEFRLHGVGHDGIYDSLLRVRDSSGSVLAENDDADASVYDGTGMKDPWISFTAGTSGTFYIEADSSDFRSGDYILTAVEANDAGMDFTLDEIAWQLNNQDGYPAPFDVGDDGQVNVDITALTEAGQRLARAALQQWSDLTGIGFVEVTEGGEIIFDDSESGYSAYARRQYSVVDGDWYVSQANIMVTTDWLDAYGTGYGSYSFQTYIHEIGHALGLDHAGDYNGSAVYGSSNFYLNDSNVYSVMSYFQPSENTYVGGSFYNMLTPVLADAIAATNFYGRSTDTRTGDTTYGFNSNTGDTVLDLATNYSRPNFMVHDDGGTDTIDMSRASQDQTINLNDGTLSSVLGGTYNMSISRGTVIENAIGGTGRDTITGNAAANTISGGAGDDVIDGGGGADTLDGGEGADTLSFAGSASGLLVVLQNGAAAIISGTDTQGMTATGFENVTGSAHADRIVGDDGSNVIDGGAGDDRIAGGLGADRIIGGEGNDWISGGAGADVLDGGDGVDTLSYASSAAGVTVTLNGSAAATVSGGDAEGDTATGFENVDGSAFDDTLTGDGGANVIAGGAGYDTLNGGAGDDLLIGGAGADTIDGGEGIDTVSYEASAERVVLGPAVDGFEGSGGDAEGDLLAGIENIIGSAYDDQIIGTGIGNLLRGGAGNDVLLGMDGEDVIEGGEGNDTIFGGNHDDTIEGGAGDDRISGGAGADTLFGGDGFDWLNYDVSAAGVQVSFASGSGGGGDAEGDVIAGFEGISGSNHADELTGDDGGNHLRGLAGDDVIEGGAGADVLEGEFGQDTLSYASSAAGVTVTLNGSAAATVSGGDAEGDTATGFENITGSAFDDTLTGDTVANVIAGGAGDDIIEGGAGGDTLYGGDGVDTLSYATSSNAVSVALVSGAEAYLGSSDAQGDKALGFENVLGSAYADRIIGDTGANVIDGGAGDDRIAGGAGADILRGGDGIDWLAYGDSSEGVNVRLNDGAAATVSGGTAQGDTATGFENVTGSIYNDRLTGNAEANVLDGNGGDDVIEGGAGADTLDGDDGVDTLSYASSAAGVTVTLNGSAAATVSGGDAEGDTATGFENITGSAFDDTLTGDSGANVLDGGAGRDMLYGGDGDDVLHGGAGDDIIHGVSGTNILQGGAGLDFLVGGSGTDHFHAFDRNGSGNGDHGARMEGHGGDDVFHMVGGIASESAFGGDGNDTFHTTEGLTLNDSYDGGAGIDTAYFYGGVGMVFTTGAQGTIRHVEFDFDGTLDFRDIEVVHAGSGDDVFVGSSQVEQFHGNDGDDRFNAGSGVDGGDAWYGGAGTNSAYFTDAGAVVVSLAEGTMQNRYGGGGEGTLSGFANVYGGDGFDLLIGNAGANTLSGGEGFDALYGGAGDDTIYGGARGDLIGGGAGADTLDGGDGYDTLVYVGSDAGVRVWLGGNEVSGGHAEGDTIASFENVMGSGHDDRLIGSYQVNRIEGGAGDDVIAGYNGNDTLLGGDGRDIIYGNNDDDRLVGGAGRDILYGGADNDVFVYESLADNGLLFADRDRIQDFVHGEDRIDLSALDADTGAGGNQAFAFTGRFFTGEAGQVRAYEWGGLTFIEGDVDGDRSADFRIELAGAGLGIDASDFVL